MRVTPPGAARAAVASANSGEAVDCKGKQDVEKTGVTETYMPSLWRGLAAVQGAEESERAHGEAHASRVDLESERNPRLVLRR